MQLDESTQGSLSPATPTRWTISLASVLGSSTTLMVYDSANAPTRAFPRLHVFHPCQHGAHPPRGQSGQMPVPGWAGAYFTWGNSSLELHGVAKALTPL